MQVIRLGRQVARIPVWPEIIYSMPTMFDFALGASPPDSIAHIIQVALAPAFLLSALATLLNVFSTRLGRVADKVDAASLGLSGLDPEAAIRLSRHLAHLRRRSSILDVAVVLASIGGVMTGVAVLTLFVGALRDAATASMLFSCFGASLLCTIGAIVAFAAEILVAGRGIRDQVDQHQDETSARKH